jgi:23S rRNA pseudouridine1911/1915/1917 synthase
MPPIVFLADRRDSGQTLAAVLKHRLNLPWSKVKQTIERRHVRVGGQIVADGAYRVKAGKRITIAVGAIEQPRLAPTPTASNARQNPKRKPQKEEKKPTTPRAVADLSSAIVVTYSDKHLVVVDKPAGMTTMRHAEEAAEFGHGKRFLPATLMDKLPPLLSEPKAKLIAVHRIDRDTSGLVVFARTKAAAAHLMKQFRAHSVERKYLALVRGTPQPGKIESLLVRDRGDGRRGSGEGGQRAVTHVAVLWTVRGFSLVECRLETGRTHQVRIHLGETGTPLCGETVYDRPPHGQPLPDGSGAARPMLHAAVLGFTHPATGERMRFEAEPHADFAALQQALAKT